MDLQSYLQPTETIDHDQPLVRELSSRLCHGADDVFEKSRRLFLFVRDMIAYSPYVAFFEKDDYRASATLRRAKGYCVQKAIVLCALARAAYIPARLVCVDIRNYRAPARLVKMMGTDLFVYHSYTELLIENEWRKATPTFDTKLCSEHEFPILEFDGHQDAVFPAIDTMGRPFIDYENDHGSFADLPFEQLLAGWREAYGEDRVSAWIQAIESGLLPDDRF